MRNRSLVTAFFSALALVASSPEDAHACGGTFCDGPTPMQPQPMPVKQSGETIVFVLDGPSVEVHIQIQYTGDPRKFGWVIPLQKPPTDIQPGSQAFFTSLIAGTTPTFAVTNSTDACATPQANAATRSSSGSSGDGFSCGSSSSGGASSPTSADFGGTGAGGGTSGGKSGSPPDVTVKRVGAFEVDLLTGGTAQGVTDWLTQNGYQLNAAADPILAKYLAEGYMFAAVKLSAGESTKEIHPIVFRYPGNEPCVPLRLTQIAAEPSMGIRAFFLGDDRVVPTTYKHVVMNEAAFDWSNPGQNYEQIVGRATAAPTADGHAFVTDYYGPSSVVNQSSLVSVSWNANQFAGASPIQVPSILAQQGLALQCSATSCTAPHPLVMPLLEKWIPAPAGVPEGTFYSNLSSFQSKLVPGKWDANGFQKDFQERIVGPGQHAVDLLTRWGNVTRLYTTMSPELMDRDPIFAARPGLPQVPLAHTALLRTTCDQRQGIELSDGRHVYQPTTAGTWPPFTQDLPAAARVEDYSAGATPVVLLDTATPTDGVIGSWNQSNAWPPPPQFRASATSGCSVGRPKNENLAIALGLLGGLGLIRRATRAKRRLGDYARPSRERAERGDRRPLAPCSRRRALLRDRDRERGARGEAEVVGSAGDTCRGCERLHFRRAGGERALDRDQRLDRRVRARRGADEHVVDRVFRRVDRALGEDEAKELAGRVARVAPRHQRARRGGGGAPRGVPLETGESAGERVVVDAVEDDRRPDRCRSLGAGTLIVRRFFLRYEDGGNARVHQLAEGVVARRRDRDVARRDRVPCLGGREPGDARAADGRAAKERPRGDEEPRVGVHGDDPRSRREERARVGIAASARARVDDERVRLEPEPSPRFASRRRLGALPRDDRSGEEETLASAGGDAHRSAVVVLRHEDAIVEREHRLKVRAVGDRVAHGAMDERAALHEVERREELAERAARERVDDEEIRPQEREGVPDPLLRERDVGSPIDARVGDRGLRGNLERGEALAKERPFGLTRAQKPRFERRARVRGVASHPARDRGEAGEVTHARPVDRIEDDARSAHQDASARPGAAWSSAPLEAAVAAASTSVSTSSPRSRATGAT